MKQGLDFAKVKYLEQGIVEIIPHDCIDITLDNIQELQQLISKGSTPKRIIMNCQKKYAYTFNAMMAMRNLTDIQAMAAIIDNFLDAKKPEVILGDVKKLQYLFERFTDRDEAIHWLLSVE